MPVGDEWILEGLDGIPPRLAETAQSLALIDHHVHGCYVEKIDRGAFEESFNEASTDPIPAFMTQFDSQPGFAFRRWCAPLLGLERHAPADEYWAARSALTPAELDRRLLPLAGVEHWVMDTGFSLRPITDPAAMAAESGGATSEIVRLEVVAEGLLATGVAPADFAEAFRAAIAEAAVEAKGFKTIVAYRVGFDIDWEPPTDAAVAAAVARWAALGQERPRLSDPVLEAFVVHAAVALGLPLQVHVGFGDRDLDLHRTNPMLLLPLLRRAEVQRTPIMLLHCYPYHRESAYLAQGFDNVYFDIGLGVNYLGAQSRQLIAEALELAPFAKQLYSSDAFGLPELHLVGSILWRRGMAAALGRWVREGEWSEHDACRVLEMIGAENARRVYGL
ncbi:amidohydrolase family protein [Microbacterium sp. ASV81]|uniref:Amidohydrolase family protein n=1 Tax=Microbacterium capsulatum TaxID=3041921 RepID=A0ABU0XMI6_9MICO|nr:amidohydrolase family protein [Microbacterium sp. ASV81]MDQ4214940.1 amidohydrolase family protein [Microbacterium sp. ASV81]